MLGISESEAVAALMDAFPKGPPAEPRGGAKTEAKDDTGLATKSEIQARLENTALTHKGFPVREMLAYPSGLAAKLLGISRTTFWLECQMGRIRRTPQKTVPREELVRYLGASISGKQSPRRAPTRPTTNSPTGPQTQNSGIAD